MRASANSAIVWGAQNFHFLFWGGDTLCAAGLFCPLPPGWVDCLNFPVGWAHKRRLGADTDAVGGGKRIRLKS